MTQIGDKKEKVKFALFPVEITNKLNDNKYIWFKKYKDIFEYQQFRRREMQPVKGIVSEDGRPIFDRRFSGYEWVEYEKWVRIKRIVKF